MAEHTEHIVTKKTYGLIFATLLILTGVTTAVGYVDLGRMNVVVALAIAAIKAVLVILFFMHLAYSRRLTQITLVAAIMWLTLLIALTLADVFTRGWIAGAGS
jgi:cytochrome c oxidase subunit 4